MQTPLLFVLFSFCTKQSYDMTSVTPHCLYQITSYCVIRLSVLRTHPIVIAWQNVVKPSRLW